MLNFSKLIWKQCEILHNTAYEYTGKCIIGIPVYKSTLTETEKASLNQLCKIIGHSYEICLICPDDIQLNDYVNIAYNNEVYLSFLFCAKDYFKSTESYSYLCETAEFYKCFKEYDYLFIYQLDGWIFSNLLYYYINLNVDYIGGLWGDGHKESIGNGGVSLRRVQKFIDICEGLTEEDYKKDYVKQEDIFFCETLRNKAKLKFPSLKNASNFALTNRYQYFIQKYNNNHLPMCLHAWDRPFNDVMKNYISITYNDGPNITQKEINSKNLYDFSSILKLQKKQGKPITNKENVVVNDEDEKQIQFIHRSEIKRRQMPKIEIPQQTIVNNVNKDWNQILNIKKSNNNWKLTYELVKNNTYTATPKKHEYTFDSTPFEEIKITHQKHQHQIKEQPIEYKEKRVVDNKKINILIVHYNTPYLTECLVKSINKFVGKNCVIYIFDNSDKLPFTYRQNNIIIFDNTKGQIINFDKWLEQFPEKNKSSAWKNNYGSAKHSKSIQKCIELIDENFILLDSDILLKKDIHELYDTNFTIIGDTESWKPANTYEKQQIHSRIRLKPYICFINVNNCKKKNIKYHNDNCIYGLTKNGDNYDTGAYIYEECINFKEPFKKINCNDYITHYKGGSWVDQARKIDNYRQISQDEWLENNKQYWKNNKVIYTCITNNYENVVDPTFIQNDFDYICFTDNMCQTSNIWNFREIPNELKTLSKIKQQRIIKICPHLYLPEYDESIWVDGSIDILGDMNKFINTYCNVPNKSIFIRKHPYRDCIYDEGKECIRIHKDKFEIINQQLEKYKNENYPKHNGLVETNIIYRKHNDLSCIETMNIWANEVKNNSHRDQLSFNYALWKNKNIGFQYLPKFLSHSNLFEWHKYHNRK